MEKKFELEGPVEMIQEEEPNCRYTTVCVLMVIFLIFFLTISSIFIYYQFYIGRIDGKYVFDWSLKKKNTNYFILKKIEEKNNILQNKLDSCSSGLISSNSTGLFSNPGSGEIYCVQIGAFRSFNFTKYEPGLVNMFVDSENGVKKLIIGGFTKLTDACDLKHDLISSGIKGVFIIKKVDGMKVKFKSSCP